MYQRCNQESNPQKKKDLKNLAKQIDKTALQKIFKIIRKSLYYFLN